MSQGVSSRHARRDALREQWAAVRDALRSRAVPMLQGWCGRAVQERELQVACGLHAHLVLLHRGFAEDETGAGLTAPTVCALLSAQVFININGRAPPPGDGAADPPAVKGQVQFPSLVPALLGVLQFEIFDTFQRLRWPLLRWLQTHREDCNTVMEAVVRTITFANEGRAEKAVAQKAGDAGPGSGGPFASANKLFGVMREAWTLSRAVSGSPLYLPNPPIQTCLGSCARR